jgi:hypothetical protein
MVAAKLLAGDLLRAGLVRFDLGVDRPLYMRVAKNRAEIEAANPQWIPDLTLNETAALRPTSAS